MPPVKALSSMEKKIIEQTAPESCPGRGQLNSCDPEGQTRPKTPLPYPVLSADSRAARGLLTSMGICCWLLPQQEANFLPFSLAAWFVGDSFPLHQLLHGVGVDYWSDWVSFVSPRVFLFHCLLPPEAWEKTEPKRSVPQWGRNRCSVSRMSAAPQPGLGAMQHPSGEGHQLPALQRSCSGNRACCRPATAQQFSRPHKSGSRDLLCAKRPKDANTNWERWPQPVNAG